MKGQWQNRPHSIRLYLPCRSAVILIPLENLTEEIREAGQIVIPSVTIEKVVPQVKDKEEVKDVIVEKATEEEKKEDLESKSAATSATVADPESKTAVS